MKSKTVSALFTNFATVGNTEKRTNFLASSSILNDWPYPNFWCNFKYRPNAFNLTRHPHFLTPPNMNPMHKTHYIILWGWWWERQRKEPSCHCKYSRKKPRWWFLVQKVFKVSEFNWNEGKKQELQFVGTPHHHWGSFSHQC